jgi:hypothetical protein
MERKMENAIEHVCENCLFKKEIVLTDIDEKDIEEYEKIQVGLDIAQSVKKPENMPTNASSTAIKAYFEVVFEKEAYYKKQEMEWWRRIMKKYNISDKTKIDVFNKLFYHCLDAKGNEVIDFVPKKIVSKSSPKPIK